MWALRLPLLLFGYSDDVTHFETQLSCLLGLCNTGGGVSTVSLVLYSLPHTRTVPWPGWHQRGAASSESWQLHDAREPIWTTHQSTRNGMICRGCTWHWVRFHCWLGSSMGGPPGTHVLLDRFPIARACEYRRILYIYCTHLALDTIDTIVHPPSLGYLRVREL
jgi:hypothetical protein